MIAVISAISGIALGWLGGARTVKKDLVRRLVQAPFYKRNVEYIKRGVDDIRIDLRMQGQKVDNLTERVRGQKECGKRQQKMDILTAHGQAIL
jgi:hypothetical protein